ncbi:hypothetical protein LCGC14_2090580 [marine sediment metagenome]|uniref:Fibronectin type-III domain-containing protein n=1 Tax=marine sediment metagenome TaxID=412755 RepID=A0A0F9H9P2_9ZZZZ
MAFEDLSTYTEVDPNSRLTKTTRRVAWTALQRDEDAYIYYDKGADHFSGDFTHHLTIDTTAAGTTSPGSKVFCWAITNLVNDMKGIQGSSGDYFAVFLYRSFTGVFEIYLEECNGGIPQQTAYTAALNTIYYLKVVRDESVGTYGTIYCYIYSDAARTTLLATLTQTIDTAKRDFRYVFACNTWNSGETVAMTGYTENLELLASLATAIVTTQPTTDIASTTATGNGTIVNLGLSAVTAHGHVVDTTIDPKTTADGGSPVVEVDNGVGSLGVFTSSVTDLLAGQEYYMRAYATNSQGTVYGANAYFIAGQPGTLRIKGEFAVVQTQWHYVDEDGRERQLTGTLV